MDSALWGWAVYSLQHHLYENATFLSERLVAEASSEASKLLLATCYFQSGAPARAELVLHGCTAAQNRYLLALCNMQLGKLSEAQRALGVAGSDPDGIAQAG